MIGDLIGAGLGAITSIVGGVQASKAAKEAKAGVEAARKKNEDWFNRAYNEDPTRRASAVAAVTRMQEELKKQQQQAAGTNAVMGGSTAAQAASKAAANQALAQTTSNIAAAGDARKDAIEATYMQNDAAYQAQLNDMDKTRAQSIAQATAGAAQALGGADFGIVDDWLGTNKK